MTEIIPSNPKVMKNALEISMSILDNIELNKAPLSSIAFKAARLANILKESKYEKIFEYEVIGYPSSKDGFSTEIWELLEIANRTYQEKDEKTGTIETFAYGLSIEDLEIDGQTFFASGVPMDNFATILFNRRKYLRERKSFIYKYALYRYNELKFAGLAEDAFTRIREFVDESIGSIVPSAVEKFNSVYENLESNNPEDWSNAVHSCRRILEDLADATFPPQSESRTIGSDGKKKEIKLGKKQYVNRLLVFTEENSQSSRFTEIVGSNIKFLEDRLWGAFRASQKGTHTTIFSREEADRYVVYTYMIVGDILSLCIK